MPILKDNRPTKTISLPSYEGSEVEVFASLLVGDLTEVDLIDESLANGVKTLKRLIKRWNFTDDKNVDLSINEENLKLLKPTDLDFLLKEIKKFSEEEKKS